MKHGWLIVVCLALVGCDRLTAGAKEVGTSAQKSRDETVEAWRGLLIYNPQPKPIPLPAQRRFCYQKPSDIVCYDAAQPDLGAPLVGAQEGVPGRMVAGAQGETITVPVPQAAPADLITVQPNAPANAYTAPVSPWVKPVPVQVKPLPPMPESLKGCKAGGPFPCKESPYIPGAKVGK
jgi:hypothetical protein